MAYQSISEIQSKLKASIVESINGKLMKYCEKIVQKYLQENVYQAYFPKGEHPYDRTMELMNCVTVGNITVGTKYIRFDIYMDTEKIQPYVTSDNMMWNQHASVTGEDVSDFIPLWIEEGTRGSLWDRDGAHYMEQAYQQLNQGDLAQALAYDLRAMGWNVVTM